VIELRIKMHWWKFVTSSHLAVDVVTSCSSVSIDEVARLLASGGACGNFLKLLVDLKLRSDCHLVRECVTA
jgi:hypothetical protein